MASNLEAERWVADDASRLLHGSSGSEAVSATGSRIALQSGPSPLLRSLLSGDEADGGEFSTLSLSPPFAAHGGWRAAPVADAQTDSFASPPCGNDGGMEVGVNDTAENKYVQSDADGVGEQPQDLGSAVGAGDAASPQTAVRGDDAEPLGEADGEAVPRDADAPACALPQATSVVDANDASGLQADGVLHSPSPVSMPIASPAVHLCAPVPALGLAVGSRSSSPEPCWNRSPDMQARATATSSTVDIPPSPLLQEGEPMPPLPAASSSSLSGLLSQRAAATAAPDVAGPVPPRSDAARGGAPTMLAGETEDEPPACPDEDSALAQRLRPLHLDQTRSASNEHASGSASAQGGQAGCGGTVASRSGAIGSAGSKAPDVPIIDERDGGWCGTVAAERQDGPRLPLTGGRLPPGGEPSTSKDAEGRHLECAQQDLRVAMQALAICEGQLVSHFDNAAGRDPSRLSADVKTQREIAALAADLGATRAEAGQLRRELLRLRGTQEELSVLPTGMLYSLQQELSVALGKVQTELEARTKCCVCKEVERQVLLRPCRHLALCLTCARRSDRCPLCRRSIDRYEAVCVA